MDESNLIFIISQPRSGSTYLQNLLSNNGETNTCSEPWLLLHFANQFKPSLFQTTFDNTIAASAFEDYLGKHPSIDYNKEQKTFLLNLYKPLFEGFQFAIDKTPRYWEIMDEIVVLFPSSKIIILKRNPIDVAKSMIKTWNIKSISQLTYFKRDLLLAPKRIHSFCGKHCNNTNVYTLQYETLINNTAEEVKKVYEWIGIAFHEAVLETSKNEKYKGKYGDPYQNSEKSYIEVKTDAKRKVLNKSFLSFLKGYSHYLGEDFLKEYGGYKTPKGQRKHTHSFAYFLHLSKETSRPSTFKKEFKYLFKETYYRLFN